jgi:hypothetical protein
MPNESTTGSPDDSNGSQPCPATSGCDRRPAARWLASRTLAHPSADVLLDVPELRVDELSLEVEDLPARVSTQADGLSLLRLHVGVEGSSAG